VAELYDPAMPGQLDHPLSDADDAGSLITAIQGEGAAAS